MEKVSKRQLERYPIYLNYLLSLRESGVSSISSPVMAKSLSLSEEQVRKDLQLVSSSDGKPKTGRDINELINDIQKFLGYKSVTNAAVIGVGHLGKALMNYKGFSEFGLNIVCGFDVDPSLINTEINGKGIYSLYFLSSKIEQHNIKIAILVTPKETAQGVADMLVNAGIKAIWNFVPVHLNINQNVAVENVNLASSLAILEHSLNRKGDEK